MLDDVEREEFYVYEKCSLRKKEAIIFFMSRIRKCRRYMVQYKEAKNPAGVTETVLDMSRPEAIGTDRHTEQDRARDALEHGRLLLGP